MLSISKCNQFVSAKKRLHYPASSNDKCQTRLKINTQTNKKYFQESRKEAGDMVVLSKTVLLNFHSKQVNEWIGVFVF